MTASRSPDQPAGSALTDALKEAHRVVSFYTKYGQCRQTTNAIERLASALAAAPVSPEPAKSKPRGEAFMDAWEEFESGRPASQPAEAVSDLPEPALWASKNVLSGKTRYEKLPVQSLQPGVYSHSKLYTEEQVRDILAIAGTQATPVAAEPCRYADECNIEGACTNGCQAPSEATPVAAQPAEVPNTNNGERCAPTLAQHNGVKTHDRRTEEGSSGLGKEGPGSGEAARGDAACTSGAERGTGPRDDEEQRGVAAKDFLALARQFCAVTETPSGAIEWHFDGEDMEALAREVASKAPQAATMSAEPVAPAKAQFDTLEKDAALASDFPPHAKVISWNLVLDAIEGRRRVAEPVEGAEPAKTLLALAEDYARHLVAVDFWSGKVVASVLLDAAYASKARLEAFARHPAPASAQAGAVPEGWKIEPHGSDEVVVVSPAGERWRYRNVTGTGTDSEFIYPLLCALAAPKAGAGEAS